ncbi:MAG: DEAD/DEAH box helicase family protein [Clostridia bacterium]|nr:DEAD/DEAH box helicase family protein [Clostridia bacterium]
MIDHNDVKMPVQRTDLDSRLNEEEKTEQIVNLLSLVNDVENKQMLRLREDYYSRFNWFGANTKRSNKSYFSYQEEAVYNFIFNLNKSGILSDQVGMGKTIEAGMIISELASRNELRSLLIIVPNEIMASKWEVELAEKFGIREYLHVTDEAKERYPGVKAVKNYEDFCLCVYDCVATEKFSDLYNHEFTHKYSAKEGDTLASVLSDFIRKDIEEAVELINGEYGAPFKVAFDGKKFSIVGTNFVREYKYDASGEIAKYIGRFHTNTGAQIEQRINREAFKRPYKRLLSQELTGLYAIMGEYFSSDPQELHNIALRMADKEHFPILVIPINYSDYSGDKVKLIPFLNKELLPKEKVNDYRYRYSELNDEGIIDKTTYDCYRIIDFFIEVGYQTLIVDEVHDYIDVAAKIDRTKFHEQNGFKMYPSADYSRFELFDDYYFIKKESLFKKLKDLADKANRKIFLTATPIKSDMVDFYLLSLLASNKDSDAFRVIRENFESQVPDPSEAASMIESLYEDFKECLATTAAEYFTGHSSECLKKEFASAGENEQDARFLYPYFNNSYLINNRTNTERIKKYLLGHLSYMSLEEMFMSIVIAYNAEMKADRLANYDIVKILKELSILLTEETGTLKLARVVFRSLLDNPLKQRFEADFEENGKPIQRIRELLELSDGPKRWHDTYRKYGIRHTRHQTYNLSACDDLSKLNSDKQDRYTNLPVWPRRNGKVIFLLRDDVFFDCFLEMRKLKEEAKEQIKMSDLPNYEKLFGKEQEKQQHFESALEIFDYINDSMSGGDSQYHKPQNSRYESVRINDEHMLDYKLALVNKLMTGNDANLGKVANKVLLFAEKDRDAILEWFKYQNCEPLCNGFVQDKAKAEQYEKHRESYTAGTLRGNWKVSESTEDLNAEGNVLIIIDPKRYEKGIDLQKADTIINFDINYDPLKMEQRIGRIDRIRPSGQNPEITIISFVSLNDMSGMVINFFANEMKMFTQWMGETTGIVSIPESDGENSSKFGQGVSFEDKIVELESFYKDLYKLCNQNVTETEAVNMATKFCEHFGNCDENIVAMDFRFLRELREYFDTAFRNSISPQRQGYMVEGSDDRVVRFNSTRGVFSPCASTSCDKCDGMCDLAGKERNNVYSKFKSNAIDFVKKGKAFYDNEKVKLMGTSSASNGDRGVIKGVDDSGKSEFETYLKARMAEFGDLAKGENAYSKAFPEDNNKPFVIPFDEYLELFNPLKKLYWDEIVAKYLSIILSHFHMQCDSVLDGAKLFEKFIKTLTIAEFMSDMEGNV